MANYLGFDFDYKCCKLLTTSGESLILLQIYSFDGPFDSSQKRGKVYGVS